MPSMGALLRVEGRRPCRSDVQCIRCLVGRGGTREGEMKPSSKRAAWKRVKFSRVAVPGWMDRRSPRRRATRERTGPGFARPCWMPATGVRAALYPNSAARGAGRLHGASDPLRENLPGALLCSLLTSCFSRRYIWDAVVSRACRFSICRGGFLFVKFDDEGAGVNKSELIDQIALDAELSKAAAGRALDAAISAVKQALKKGDSVTLVGFGTFNVGKRAARTGRNPRTGAAIKIQSAKIPKFRPGKALKDALN